MVTNDVGEMFEWVITLGMAAENLVLTLYQCRECGALVPAGRMGVHSDFHARQLVQERP
jgi:hypothetical protein